MDVAEVVDGSDEGAEEEGIDKCDKVGVCRGAVVAEEGEDCPGESENRDDEEDEDGIGCQGVLLDESINEPGEHAHTRDLIEGVNLGGYKNKVVVYQPE